MYERIDKLRLLKDVPMIGKGIFFFDHATSNVYWQEESGAMCSTPLRHGLAGYLWLLRYEAGYFRKAKEGKDVDR